MLSNTTIAKLVADQLKADFALDVQATPVDEKATHDGSPYFKLEVVQNFGIFDSIIKKAWIAISAGEVRGAKETDSMQLSVRVSLNYEHLNGGTNGNDICNFWFEGEKLVGTRKG